MKSKFLLLLSLSSALVLTGCGTPLKDAAVVETGTVQTVDGAMATWAKYCYATNATASQINDVSNAYTSYVNAQTIASNVLAYAASSGGILNVTNALSALSNSSTALVNIITLYTTKK